MPKSNYDLQLYQLYLLDGKEVKQTGRRASKTIKSSSTTGRTPSNLRIIELVEVESIENEISITWKKWVKEEELYVITDTNK